MLNPFLNFENSAFVITKEKNWFDVPRSYLVLHWLSILLIVHVSIVHVLIWSCYDEGARAE